MPLAEVEYDYKDFDNRESADDRNVHVRFYMRPWQNPTETAQQGRPIFEDREYVEIRASGNSTNVIDRPVTDLDRARFRRQYAMFRGGASEQIVGTRLSEVTWLTRSQCEELAHLRVYTVEQLSSINDQLCTQFSGLYEARRKAQAFLSASEAAAPITAIQAENAELKSMLSALQDQLRLQGEALQRLSEEEKKESLSHKTK